MHCVKSLQANVMASLSVLCWSASGRPGKFSVLPASLLALSSLQPSRQPDSPASANLQVAFPYLYNNRPRKVQLSTYHYPMVAYIKMEDPDLPAFYFDPLIHPIPPHQSQGPKLESWEVGDDEEDDFVLPEGVDPFLVEQPLYTETTAAGIALLWAPRPFDLR